MLRWMLTLLPVWQIPACGAGGGGCCLPVKDWMRAHKLKLNPDDTEVLEADSNLRSGCTLMLDWVALPRKKQVHTPDATWQLCSGVLSTSHGCYACLGEIEILNVGQPLEMTWKVK